MESYDVGIVGAGVHGASAAFHLAGRGLRVKVYERGQPAEGPTGYSSAVCRAFYTNTFLAAAARESIDMLANFADLTEGGDAGYRRTGGLFLHHASDGPELGRVLQRLVEIGTAVDQVSTDQLEEYLPGIKVTGDEVGVWERDAGYADPAGVTMGLLSQAARLGAHVARNTNVASISAGRNPRLVAADGETSVGRVLVAAGPWTTSLLPPSASAVSLTAERHIVVHAQRPPGTSHPASVFADVRDGYYVRPEGSDSLFLGPLHETGKVDPDEPVAKLDTDEASALLGVAAQRLPLLADAGLRGGWSSLYDVSPDWQPVVGEVDENVFIDAGTSGHGFKLAAGWGRHVADVVTDDDPDPGMRQFRPQRFTDGEQLSSGWHEAKILG